MKEENKKSAIRSVENLLVNLHSGKVKSIFAISLLEGDDDYTGIQEVFYLENKSVKNITLTIGAIEVLKINILNALGG